MPPPALAAALESPPLPALLHQSQLHHKLHWTSDRLRGDKTEPSRGIPRHVYNQTGFRDTKDDNSIPREVEGVTLLPH